MNKKMNHIFKILVVVIMTIGLSCNKEEDNVTTIKFWAMGSEAEFVTKLISEFEKQNPDIKVHGIPWYTDTRLMFYRKDVFEKAGYNHPPKTWAELLDLSRKIKALYKGEDKYAIYLPTNEWAPFVIFGLQAGGDLLKNQDTEGNFSSKEFKEAFSYLVNFHKEKLAPIGISQV